MEDRPDNAMSSTPVALSPNEDVVWSAGKLITGKIQAILTGSEAK